VLLSVLVGSGLFVFLMVGSQMLGGFPPLPQGYALGFFLIMFVGLALGVGRYRLFDLDRWAYYVLLWVGGAALVLALDAAMISVLHMPRRRRCCLQRFWSVRSMSRCANGCCCDSPPPPLRRCNPCRMCCPSR
jgi:hypothetical protein